MALSFTVALSPLSHALSPINSTQDGQIIKGGTFYNTATSQTTFVNTASGDLWLQVGTTVRGLEVNSSGNLTNNGGNFLLSAPGHVVRVDGNINVNGLLNGQGDYLGNGGKVTVNATYLYQNGQIFAQGVNGGHAQFNVNSATFGPQALVDAHASPGGLGGSIHIKASGVVDIKSGAVLLSNGVPGVDANVIEVIGGLVNNEGQVQADGIYAAQSTDANKASAGILRLVAQSNINLNPVATALTQAKVFNAAEKQSLFNRTHDLAKNYDGSIRNTGELSANGNTLALPPNSTAFQGDGGTGGTIALSASRSILNSGGINANGGEGANAGNGGQITFRAGCLSRNDGQISASGGSNNDEFGHGGTGGHITLNYLINKGSIAAYGGSTEYGGDGGRIDLSRIWNYGNIYATGGAGSSKFPNLGGLGGIINATNFVNEKDGALTADGGNGSGFGGGNAGDGGIMTLTNFTNKGFVTVIGGGGGGALYSYGGRGGRIIGNNVTNAGTIWALGGNSFGQAGSGGTMTFTKLQNSGTITANGGEGIPGSDIKTTGGDGGLIKASQVTNTGTIQALGGPGDTNGHDGQVILF